jgi:gluconokinase
MAEYFIGIDIGTGSTKALAVDSTGTVLTSAQNPYITVHPQEEYCEQDPETIWKAFVLCVTQVVNTLQSKPSGIALSAAMHSLILIDKQNQPLTGMITWADNRASDIAEKIKTSPAGKSIYEETGTPIHAMSPLCKIIWFKEHQAELFKEAVKFISIKEYIWYKLFNTYEVDYSIASATGLMDIQALTWNNNALDLAGISNEQVSTLVDTSYIRRGVTPSLANELGIEEATTFMIGASDGCMANLGSFATEPGVAALTIGTSGAIRVASKTPLYNFDAMTFNYRLDKDTFICGGPTNNGGIVLKWYAESFLGKKLSTSNDYHELLAKTKATPIGSDGLMFLPFILGERAPIWNSGACGVFFGIKTHHTQAYFTRAVLEGVSMALYNIGENMEKLGLDIEQINVSGGFVHSTEWLQILANIFGKRICLINTSDASALGAAYMGLKTTGMITDYTDLKSKGIKEIHPEPQYFDYYQKHYLFYLELYKSLSVLMKNRLNQ